MKIVTSHDRPPIPTRDADWSAIDADTYDGAEDSNCPIGRGPTERDAINALVEELLDREESRLADSHKFVGECAKRAGIINGANLSIEEAADAMEGVIACTRSDYYIACAKLTDCVTYAEQCTALLSAIRSVTDKHHNQEWARFVIELIDTALSKNSMIQPDGSYAITVAPDGTVTDMNAKSLPGVGNAARNALERARGCITGLLARTPVRDVSETLAEIDAALAKNPPDAIAAPEWVMGQEARSVNAQFHPTDSERLAWLHKPNKDAEGFEYGVARVKFDAHGQLVACSWTLSDHSDIDAEILREAAR